MANFNLDHYVELMDMAYKNNNFEEAERYVTLILDNTSPVPSYIWIYKGSISGRQSTPQKPRIQEMIMYFEKARKSRIPSVDLEPQELDEIISIRTSYVVLLFVADLIDTFSEIQQQSAYDSSRRIMFVPGMRTRDVLLGGSIVKSLAKSSKKDTAKELGKIFRTTYGAEDVLPGFSFAWGISQHKHTADNIMNAFEEIIRTKTLDDDSKKLFIENDAADLIKSVRHQYPALKLPKIKKGWFSF